MRTTVIALAFALATALCGNVHAAASAKKHVARAGAKPPKKVKRANKAHATVPPAHIAKES
jgi:hypothetical protein